MEPAREQIALFVMTQATGFLIRFLDGHLMTLIGHASMQAHCHLQMMDQINFSSGSLDQA